MHKILLLLPMIFLVGCIGSPQGRHSGTVDQAGPNIYIPQPIAEVIKIDQESVAGKAADKAAFKAADSASAKTASALMPSIETKMKTVQDNVTGLLTTKIGEIEKLIDFKNSMSAKLENKMYADLKAEVNSAIEATANLNAQVSALSNNNVKFNSEISAKIKALSDLNTKLSGMVDGLTGQAGVNNKIEKTLETIQQDIKASAGRDVNMLPPQAVEVMINQNKTFYWTIIGIMGVIKAIALTAMMYVYRGTKQREESRTKLLMVALGQLNPEQAKSIEGKM